MKRKILLGIGISTILLLTAFTGVSASDALQRENTANNKIIKHFFFLFVVIEL